VEKALQAWLLASTPGHAGASPGAMLDTPAMQGLLQKLKLSTPAMGPQVCCCSAAS
jgi:hypothetical protein